MRIIVIPSRLSDVKKGSLEEIVKQHTVSMLMWEMHVVKRDLERDTSKLGTMKIIISMITIIIITIMEAVVIFELEK